MHELRTQGLESLVTPPNISVVRKERLGTLVIPDSYRVHDLENVGFPDLVLVCEGEVFDQPKSHEGSNAGYLIDGYRGRDRILLSGLKPNSQTSTHRHPEPIYEVYFVYHGELYLHIGEESEEVLLQGRPERPAIFVVEPGKKHYGKTGEQPTLMYIRMANASFVPPDRQHIR